MKLTRRRLLLGSAALAAGTRVAWGEAQRVVALGADMAEIAARLVPAERIVGRDSSSVYPPEVLAAADLGYVRQLGAEGILSLRPDIVLATHSAGPPETLAAVAAAGVPVMRAAEDYTPGGVIEKVQRCGAALGDTAAAARLAETLARDFAAMAATVAALGPSIPALFILSARDGAPMAAGRGTAADALLGLAGGHNVFATHEGYKPFGLEAAAAAAPQAIVMMQHTLAGMGGVAEVCAHPGLSLTPAARTQRVIAVDPPKALSFGPRLAEATQELAIALRGRGA